GLAQRVEEVFHQEQVRMGRECQRTVLAHHRSLSGRQAIDTERVTEFSNREEIAVGCRLDEVEAETRAALERMRRRGPSQRQAAWGAWSTPGPRAARSRRA